MQLTRRYWEFLGVALAVVLSAILFARPVLLLGGAVIFGWLLGMQVAFVRTLDELDSSLAVEQSVPQQAMIDEPLPFTLTAQGVSQGLDVTVSARPSAGLEMVGSREVQLGEKTNGAVSSLVAGTHTLAAPEVRITDTRGLFVEYLTRGSPREVAVQPREPKQVHVGEGGDAIPIAFGEHTVDMGESGLIPAEIREYTGGESISRIDWKATARLGTPHIRDFQAESNVATILVMDRRGRLSSGPPGETAFDYLRSSAHSYLAVIESLRDPVGCFTFDAEQIEQLVAPSSSTQAYESVRRNLDTLSLQPETANRQRKASLRHRSPMLDTETAFGQTLASFTNQASIIPTKTPLTAAIRQAATIQQGSVQLAVFTDDSDHSELRDAVAEAKRANVRLSVFMAPQLLYESETGLASDAAWERYEEFEGFRRQLAAIEGVTAYEVAPRVRIERVLETQRAVQPQ